MGVIYYILLYVEVQHVHLGVPRKRVERKCRRKDIWGNNVNFLNWIQQVQWTLSKINKKPYLRTLYRETSEVGWWKRKSWKSSLGNQYIIHKVTLFWRMVDFSFFEKSGGKKIMKLTCIILKERKKKNLWIQNSTSNKAILRNTKVK